MDVSEHIVFADSIADDVYSPADIALSFDSISAARYVSADGTILVAAIPCPIYLKSERDALKTQLKEHLCAAYGKDIIVSFDTDIFLSVRDNMSDGEKLALVQKARRRI